MADPNFGIMQARVKRAAKMDSTETDVIAFIKDCINQAAYDVARETSWPELLNHTAPSISAFTIPIIGKASLPTGFLREEKVRYAQSSPTAIIRVWKLNKWNEVVQPAPTFGYPTNYRIEATNGADPLVQIFIEPVVLTAFTTDLLLIDYYKAPPLLVNDTDILVSYRWYEEIIKRATANAHFYHNKITQGREIMAQTIKQMVSQVPTAATAAA